MSNLSAQIHQVIRNHSIRFIPTIASVFLLVILICVIVLYNQKTTVLQSEIIQSQNQKASLFKQLGSIQKQLNDLKNVDQYKRNEQLNVEIQNINKTYIHLVSSYENLIDLKNKSKNTGKMDETIALALKQLADRNYSSGESTLADLDSQIKTENDKIASASQSSSSSVPTSNTPPSSGYNRQQAQTDSGSFLVDIISADISSTRIIVDTASSDDCSNNCPVLPLSDYVSRNGAYAGINGSFFCPAEYPSCAGKTGSFDLLVMNKNKHYFNSSNNVYSTNPVVIFGGSFIRFEAQALNWGRDTSVDSVLSNFPLLVKDGQIVYQGSGDAKFNGKGSRGFVANKGNTVYIGFVYNASMSDSAKVMQTLGMENAMNLDEGGSTALWYGGYKAGPGRNIPNAILFLRK